MIFSPIIPESAPFTMEQRAWLNGFLAGYLNPGSATVSPATPAAARKPLLVLFGSQGGNAESLAKKLAKEANVRGFQARAASMEAVQAAELPGARHLLVVTSTWGDGEMPDNAAGLWESLNQNGSSPKMDGVHFAVLALGDLNYGDTFCQAGKLFDQRLEELGGRRIHPRVDCDVDFDAPATTWREGVWTALDVLDGDLIQVPKTAQLDHESIDGTRGSEQKACATGAPPFSSADQLAQRPLPEWSRKNPFPARLILSRKLNADRSEKETRHLEFSLESSGLSYEAGDALGVCAQNCPGIVASVIAAHGLDADAPVLLPDGSEAPLAAALTTHYEVRSLYGKSTPHAVSAVEFVSALRKLNPRLYSIASSIKAHPAQVHLCVAALRYELDGTAHKGVASTFVADRLPLGETTGVFIHRSKNFGVPSDGAVPIIMVGPGTGIAPFRSFLEERHATGATGKNWLVFGAQRAQNDFLYREQVEAWHHDGFLTRLSLAFSRDQAEKIYVQHRLAEQAEELWHWLEEGAHFYVCGDASRMAKDVDAALHRAIETAGGLSADAAAAYVAEMKKTKRYARDVY